MASLLARIYRDQVCQGFCRVVPLRARVPQLLEMLQSIAAELNLQSASGLTVGTRQQALKLGGSCLSYGRSRAAAWQEAWSLSGPLRRTMPGPL